ncbi:MAG TPA: nucleotide sugar dehydrogenase [Acidimicrobiales bacterium]|nr:nucleotide sugar dehydrogenase [Acidimicrobiales bacterium]
MSWGPKVVVVGQGYVGLPLAIRAVEAGYNVVGFETDDERAKRLAAGESDVADVSDDTLAQALATGRYAATDNPARLAGFDIAVIAVPAALAEGLPNTRPLEDAATVLASVLTPGATVILESTTYPGTTEGLLVPLLEEGSGLVAGEQFHVGYSPERMDPGNAEWTLETTPKVVSGIDARSLDLVTQFYDRLVNQTVPVSSPREAELSKLIETTFRHVNIALVNELAMFARQLGIDIGEAIDAAATKPFGFMRFTPGPGVGGHCLPIDPSHLSWRVRRSLGESFRFVELANDVNAHMPNQVVRRITELLNDQSRAVRGSRILLLGLAYKRNTSDTRESPAVVIANSLVRLGADVRVADPIADAAALGDLVLRVDPTPGELEAADVVVVVTDHEQFDYEAVGARARSVLDCRYVVPRAANVQYL